MKPLFAFLCLFTIVVWAESYEQSGAQCRDEKNKAIAAPAVAECAFLKDAFVFDSETKKLSVSCEVGKERVTYGFQCQGQATAQARWKLTERTNATRAPAQTLGIAEPGNGPGRNFLTQPPAQLDPRSPIRK